jgi:hypothetical protein
MTKMSQFETTLRRVQPTLLQDAVGAASIVVMLMVALHLPGLG